MPNPMVLRRHGLLQGPGPVSPNDTPFVTSVSPPSGSVAGGDTVTIGGGNFLGATVVNFGPGNPATITNVTLTQVTVTTPAHALGSVDVTVTTPAGTSPLSGADDYSYTNVGPTVTSVLPNSGPTAGGTRCLIGGTQLSTVTTVQSAPGTPAWTGVEYFPPNYVTDVFNRTLSGTGDWGVTSGNGGQWTTQKASFVGTPSVNGSAAVMAQGQAKSSGTAATSSEYIQIFPGTSALDVEAWWTVSWFENLSTTTLLGGAVQFGGNNMGLIVRWTGLDSPLYDSDRDYYRLNTSWSNYPAGTGGTQLSIRCQTPNSGFRVDIPTGIYPQTDYGASVPAGGYAYNAHVIIFQTASGPTFQCNLWKVGTTEPTTWMLNTTDTAKLGPQVAGPLGMRTSADMALSLTPPPWNNAAITHTHLSNLIINPQYPGLSAVSPAGTAGAVKDVTVTNPGGTSPVNSPADNFTYQPPANKPLLGYSIKTGPDTNIRSQNNAYTIGQSLSVPAEGMTAYTSGGGSHSPVVNGSFTGVGTPAGLSGWNSNIHGLRLFLSVEMGVWGFPPSYVISNWTTGTNVSQYYTLLANNLVSIGQANAILRLGWEFNLPLNNNPWSSTGHANYVSAWGLIHTAMMGVSGAAFLWDWNGNAGNTPGDAAYNTYKPPSNQVDIYGSDKYSQTLTDFCTGLNSAGSYQYLLALAKTDGKQVGFGEWALKGTPGTVNTPTDQVNIIDNYFAWFTGATLPHWNIAGSPPASPPVTGAGSVAYASYFDESGNTGHILSDYASGTSQYTSDFASWPR